MTCDTHTGRVASSRTYYLSLYAGKGEEHTREHGVHHVFILEQYSNISLKDFVSNQRLETCFRNAFQ